MRAVRLVNRKADLLVLVKGQLILCSAYTGSNSKVDINFGD
jgi:hypothetical protein